MNRTQPIGKLSNHQAKAVRSIREGVDKEWFDPDDLFGIRRREDTLYILEREGYVERRRPPDRTAAYWDWQWRLTEKAKTEYPRLCDTCAWYTLDPLPDHCDRGMRQYAVRFCIDYLQIDRIAIELGLDPEESEGSSD